MHGENDGGASQTGVTRDAKDTGHHPGKRPPFVDKPRGFIVMFNMQLAVTTRPHSMQPQLFILNITDGTLSGVYEADGRPAHDIVPDAWLLSGRRTFPAQIRIRKTSIGTLGDVPYCVPLSTTISRRGQIDERASIIIRTTPSHRGKDTVQTEQRAPA